MIFCIEGTSQFSTVTIWIIVTVNQNKDFGGQQITKSIEN